MRSPLCRRQAARGIPDIPVEQLQLARSEMLRVEQEIGTLVGRLPIGDIAIGGPALAAVAAALQQARAEAAYGAEELAHAIGIRRADDRHDRAAHLARVL